MEDKKNYQFQVNMKGMISLLSEYIYSSPDVFLRELLQNATDAITMRRSLDQREKGKIQIYIKDTTLEFKDNGVGLTLEDVHQFLSVIGQSSKRGAYEEQDLIGKFGIGLLSCLVVSEEIVVETRSLYREESVRWIGKADGTYTVETIDLLPEIGTKVILKAKNKWKHLFNEDFVKKQLLHYGSALPISIELIVNGEIQVLTEGNPIWLDKHADKTELLEYGKEIFKTKFLDVFPLHSETGDLEGVAFVLPAKVNHSNSNAHKIYVKRMYLCDQATNLLPEWTQFVRCVLNTNRLQPTASRESLMNNQLLQNTKKELGSCFKDYLKVLSLNQPEILEKIIQIHHLHIKALAVSDSEVMNLFMDYLPFETNHGMQLFSNIKNSYSKIFYTPLLDDFRQIRRIAGSQQKLVINSAYSYETELIEKIRRKNPELHIEEIEPQDVLNEVQEEVTPDIHTERFSKLADKVLRKHYCKSQFKRFEPQDTPAIYIANEQALSNKNQQQLSNVSNPFASVLSHLNPKSSTMPILCFNYNNELIQKLIVIEDDLLLEGFINVLYIQALMLGGYSINKREMDTFNDALYQLLVLGNTQFIPKI